MLSNQLMGVVRAVVPAIVAYLVASGWIPMGAESDVVAAVIAIASAAWSVVSNRRTAVIQQTAAMQGTEVNQIGSLTAIHVIDPSLAAAAKEAATPVSG